MINDVNILKDLLFTLMKAQTLSSFNSPEFKKRWQEINKLKEIIEKREHRPLFNRIFTSKKIMN